jgi:hypothetical protein
MAGAAAMLMLRAGEVADSGVVVPESVALKVRLVAVPTHEAVGVPLMAPAEFMVRQVGSVPLAIVHVYGGMPPVAPSPVEY